MTSLFGFQRPVRSRRLCGERGSSVPEILVTVGIIGMVLGTSVLGLNATYGDLAGSQQAFASIVRKARMNSVTRGAHFRVSWSSDTVTTRRLQDDDADGIWAIDETYAATTETLPDGVSLSSGSTTKVEFDTRGMVASSSSSTTASVLQVTMTEPAGPNHTGGSLKVKIWPSGQIEMKAD